METVEKLGKYEIKGTLGRGAMGVVYEGWDPTIQRIVAIKTIPITDADDAETQEGIARFRREAQAAGRLTHPNIVSVFDYGETPDLAYIVMEFVNGPSLKELMGKDDRFALADTVKIMQDVLAGLEHSHEQGVVHRDIKPANLMLTSRERARARIKISDFGIARIESSSMTQAGAMMGTPTYMSPEQFMGQPVDARTDLYACGVLLYQLLTGERPFEGGLTAIMHKVLNTEPIPPSRLSLSVTPAIDAVVLKAMAKRPADRFQTAVEFADALTATANGLPLITAYGAEPETDDATLVAGPVRSQTDAIRRDGRDDGDDAVAGDGDAAGLGGPGTGAARCHDDRAARCTEARQRHADHGRRPGGVARCRRRRGLCPGAPSAPPAPVSLAPVAPLLPPRPARRKPKAPPAEACRRACPTAAPVGTSSSLAPPRPRHPRQPPPRLPQPPLRPRRPRPPARHPPRRLSPVRPVPRRLSWLRQGRSRPSRRPRPLAQISPTSATGSARSWRARPAH